MADSGSRDVRLPCSPFFDEFMPSFWLKGTFFGILGYFAKKKLKKIIEFDYYCVL